MTHSPQCGLEKCWFSVVHHLPGKIWLMEKYDGICHMFWKLNQVTQWCQGLVNVVSKQNSISSQGGLEKGSDMVRTVGVLAAGLLSGLKGQVWRASGGCCPGNRGWQCPSHSPSSANCECLVLTPRDTHKHYSSAGELALFPPWSFYDFVWRCKHSEILQMWVAQAHLSRFLWQQQQVTTGWGYKLQ